VRGLSETLATRKQRIPGIAPREFISQPVGELGVIGGRVPQAASNSNLQLSNSPAVLKCELIHKPIKHILMV